MRRHFQNFRAKLPRFRRRKFEKSTPQTPKISFKNSFAHFQTQRTPEGRCAQSANAICCDAQRRKRAIGEFSAENCSDFDVENLKNRRRKRKKSVANQLPRILRSSARQTNVQMQLRDVRNAECAAIFKISAQNCRVFGAENLKNQRRRRQKSVSKTDSRIFKRSAHPKEDVCSLQMRFLAMRNAENARSANFPRKIAAISTLKLKNDAANVKDRLQTSCRAF